MHFPKKGHSPKPKIKTGGTTLKVGRTKPANGGAKAGKG
jgi:hypothetical protein